ncbi:MAG: dTDP-glucose 4,6-dehydratase [Candidatus Levybacteria bacterium]|nr:dTDP-glucose 4,6-dehydratase [Candidatus Levybacteria bacterium]
MKITKNNALKFKKTIFITGGAGFIGSTYLNKYVPVYTYYRFVNIDCLTYAGNKLNINVSNYSNYFFEYVDIRDIKKLEKLFKKYKPTDIIHFAAESHVDKSIKDQNIFIETNVLGTHNLLSMAKKYKIHRFHMVSTDEVYGSLKRKDGAFTEKSILSPNNPYSASKAGAEFIVRAYQKTFGLDAVITRSSNNYGPNQDITKFIPLFIGNLLKNKKLPLYGFGENIRDWIYVEDNIIAIDLVFHGAQSGSIYNISGNCELSNIDIARHLIKLAGKTEKEIKYVKDRLGHDFRYAISSDKIRQELGWSPKTYFKDGILKTFLFYKNNYEKYE